jgi:phosphate acetyltransferase
MTNAIYLTTTEPYSGKSIIALGLMNLLVAKTEKLAYFKPVISREGSEKDGHLETIASHFKLNASYNEMFVFTRSEVIKHINAGNESYIIDTIIDRFKNLQERYDFVVWRGQILWGAVPMLSLMEIFR